MAVPQPARNAAKVLGAALLASSVALADVQPAQADISGLTPCKKSKAFKKREKQAIKGLKKRMKQYAEGSAPAMALQATMDRTEKRFKMYGDQGLLCGADGYPHLISEPALALKYGHAGDVFIPTFGFLYVAGYIGSVGRAYLLESKKAKSATQKEIIIDVPLALDLFRSGLAWPLTTIRELQSGDLVVADADIPISPR